MAEATVEKEKGTSTAASEAAETMRIYEVGYHVLSTVKEDEVDSVVGGIRAAIEKKGGSLIAEGAPQSIKLAYPMVVNEGGKNTSYDRAYFGWIKFEAEGEAAIELNELLSANKEILRFIIFKTVREDTRASIKSTVLREVKRTDTIQSTPQKGAATEEAGEENVSQEELDKALEDITSD